MKKTAAEQAQQTNKTTKGGIFMKKMMIMVIAIAIAIQAQVQVQAAQLRELTTEEMKMGHQPRELTTEEQQLGKNLRFLTEEELELGYVKENKKLRFLSEEELSSGYITEEKNPLTGEEVITEIFENSEVVKNTGYYIIPQKLMDELRTFARLVPNCDADNIGQTWELTDEYSLFLLYEDRNFYLVDNDTAMSVRLQTGLVSSESNADTDVTFNHPYICWHGGITGTLVASDGGKFAIWRFGVKLHEFHTPNNEWAEVLKIENVDKKVYLRSAQTVYVWDAFTDEINVVCEDYANLDFEITSQTFFYINTDGFISMINLVDGCKITLQQKAIGIEAFYAEKPHVSSINLDGELSTLPGYFNKEGNFEVW